LDHVAQPINYRELPAIGARNIVDRDRLFSAAQRQELDRWLIESIQAQAANPAIVPVEQIQAIRSNRQIDAPFARAQNDRRIHGIDTIDLLEGAIRALDEARLLGLRREVPRLLSEGMRSVWIARCLRLIEQRLGLLRQGHLGRIVRRAGDCQNGEADQSGYRQGGHESDAPDRHTRP
jgi:hypothetical protein